MSPRPARNTKPRCSSCMAGRRTGPLGRRYWKWPAKHVHTLAVDLPGIGQSIVAEPPAASRDIADMVRRVRHCDGAPKAHDRRSRYRRTGRLRVSPAICSRARSSSDHERRYSRDPTVERRHPQSCHLALRLPRRTPAPRALVAHKEGAYFDFFYEALAEHPDRISSQARARYAEAYSRPEALSAGFGWYRAFPEDAAHNADGWEGGTAIATPLLYIRGEQEPGDINSYIEGSKSRPAKRSHGDNCGLRSLRTRRTAGQPLW